MIEQWMINVTISVFIATLIHWQINMLTKDKP
jgi:hypothetical protein